MFLCLYKILRSENLANSSDGLTTQSDLEHVIGEEIGSQAWVEDFIRMISPKKVKGGVDVSRKHWPLEDFSRETDSNGFKTICKEAENPFLEDITGVDSQETPELNDALRSIRVTNSTCKRAKLYTSRSGRKMNSSRSATLNVAGKTIEGDVSSSTPLHQSHHILTDRLQ